jgi:hypothetical protein
MTANTAVVGGVITTDSINATTGGTIPSLSGTTANFTTVNAPTVVSSTEASVNTLYYPSTAVTISAGAITVTGSYAVVTPQGAAADDLTNINGASLKNGQILMLRNVGLDNITIKSTGNIRAPTGVDEPVLSDPQDVATFIYDTTLSQWLMTSFSNNV